MRRLSWIVATLGWLGCREVNPAFVHREGVVAPGADGAAPTDAVAAEAPPEPVRRDAPAPDLRPLPDVARDVARPADAAPPRDAPAAPGLKGEYFANADLSGPAVTRVDPQIDFTWMGGAPMASLPSDMFSIRWTGMLRAPRTEVFTLSCTPDDGVRIWLDGRLLIYEWHQNAYTEYNANVMLQAGRAYTLKVEYYEDTGYASIALRWSSPSAPTKVVIPPSALSQ